MNRQEGLSLSPAIGMLSLRSAVGLQSSDVCEAKQRGIQRCTVIMMNSSDEGAIYPHSTQRYSSTSQQRSREQGICREKRREPYQDRRSHEQSDRRPQREHWRSRSRSRSPRRRQNDSLDEKGRHSREYRNHVDAANHRHYLHEDRQQRQQSSAHPRSHEARPSKQREDDKLQRLRQRSEQEDPPKSSKWARWVCRVAGARQTDRHQPS